MDNLIEEACRRIDTDREITLIPIQKIQTPFYPKAKHSRKGHESPYKYHK